MRAPTSTISAAVIILGIAAGVISADTGDVLLEYRSDTGKLPNDFGWEHEGMCLDAGCPFPHDDPLAEPDPILDCHFQGGSDWGPADGLPDNDYTQRTPPDKKGRGAHINDTHPASGANHNAPAAAFDGWLPSQSASIFVRLAWGCKALSNSRKGAGHALAGAMPSLVAGWNAARRMAPAFAGFSDKKRRSIF